jgi:hypothetical protein
MGRFQQVRRSLRSRTSVFRLRTNGRSRKHGHANVLADDATVGPEIARCNYSLRIFSDTDLHGEAGLLGADNLLFNHHRAPLPPRAVLNYTAGRHLPLNFRASY